jgi:chromosome segregation ATPase
VYLHENVHHKHLKDLSDARTQHALADHAQLEQEFSSLRMERDHAVDEAHRTSQKLHEASFVLEQKANENLRLNARLNDTTEMAQELEAEWSGQSNAKLQLQRQLAERDLELGELRAQMEKIRSEACAAVPLRLENEELKCRIREMSDELDCMHQRYKGGAEAKEENSRLRLKVSEQLTSMDEMLKKHGAEMQVASKMSEGVGAALESKTQRIEALLNGMVVERELKLDCVDKMNAALQRADSLEAEVQAVRDELCRVDQELTATTNELTEAEMTTTDAESAAAAISSRKQRLASRLHQLFAQLNNRITAAKEDADRARMDLSDCRAELILCETRLQTVTEERDQANLEALRDRDDLARITQAWTRHRPKFGESEYQKSAIMN